jgi:hypothetical protein
MQRKVKGDDKWELTINMVKIKYYYVTNNPFI